MSNGLIARESRRRDAVPRREPGRAAVDGLQDLAFDAIEDVRIRGIHDQRGVSAALHEVPGFAAVDRLEPPDVNHVGIAGIHGQDEAPRMLFWEADEGGASVRALEEAASPRIEVDRAKGRQRRDRRRDRRRSRADRLPAPGMDGG